MRRTQLSALTLIETVVVVAILVTLAAIVLPVGAKAVHRAKIVSSMSKMKQLHVALSVYRSDYGGEGVYGSASAMGLPPIGSQLGAEEALWQSSCGNHPSLTPSVLNIYYMPVLVRDFTSVSSLYQENTIVFADMHCSDASTNVRNLYESKLGVGVFLGGHAALKRKPGNWRDPGWWADPPY